MNETSHFLGTEGVVGLRRWIEKVEQVFETCKCAEEDKVMFAASTFEGRALTWWNGNVHTLGLVNANHIPWTEFKTMMTTEYCPATEIQKMEQELWTLTLKGDDIEAYNNRFHELALMCPELVPTEKKKIERYTRAFPERIKGNISSSKHATLHDAINMARELVEQAVQGSMLQPQLRIEVMLGIYQSATVATFTIVGDALQSGENPNVVTGTFLLNDHYACILFDYGAEKSFVSSAFTPFIDIAPTALNNIIELELAMVSCDVIVVRDMVSIPSIIKIVRKDYPYTSSAMVRFLKSSERPEKDPGSLASVPLTLLTVKRIRTYCEAMKQDEAFRILKEKLCNAPV
ncbi:putative reverse transcriptase domain-containing protein [Tanacetum coccineum]